MACLQEWDADRRQAAHAEKSLAVRELVRLSLRVQSTGVVAELHLDTALVAPSGSGADHERRIRRGCQATDGRADNWRGVLNNATDEHAQLQIHEALLPQLPGLTFKQVRRAAARVRDPQRAVTTYGQEIPVWEASQRAYVFPSTGEHVAGDQWSTPTKGEAGRTMRHHIACGRPNEQAILKRRLALDASWHREGPPKRKYVRKN